MQFLTIYLGAMIGGNLLALYAHRYHDYRALGASGGVAGVIFAYVLLFPGGRINMYFLPIGIPSWLYAIGYLLASFYGMHRGLGNAGHDAHLGGALVGLFTAAAFHPQAIRYNPWLFVAIFGGTALLFIYMARSPMFLAMEGVDFTKAPKRGIFDFARRRGSAAPVTVGRPERRVDAILQKISESGMESLTDEEKNLLNTVSDKYRRRATRKKPKVGFPF